MCRCLVSLPKITEVLEYIIVIVSFEKEDNGMACSLIGDFFRSALNGP